MDINEEKQILIARVDKLIEDLIVKEKGVNIVILYLKSVSSKIESLINECIELQNEIITYSGDLAGLNIYKKEVVKYERLGNILKLRLGFVPTFFLTYLAFAIGFYAILKVNVPNFIVKTLGVQAPEKLISLGIAGAFLYLATELITMQEKRGDRYSRITLFIIRLGLAVVVPIVIVILFFNPTGEIKKLTLSPEILSFSCGYSAKLVIGIFNKLVEKGSKVIDAI